MSQHGYRLGTFVVGSASESLRVVILQGYKVFVELGDVGIH